MTVFSDAPTVVQSRQDFNPIVAEVRKAPEIQIDLGGVVIRDREGSGVINIDLDAVRVSGLALSIGAVWWATRAAGLLTTLLSSLPAWRTFDPLPILAPRDDEDEEDEDVWGDADSSAEEAEEEKVVQRRFSNQETQPIELAELRSFKPK